MSQGLSTCPNATHWNAVVCAYHTTVSQAVTPYVACFLMVSWNIKWLRSHLSMAGAVVEAHARAVAASVVPRATKGIPGRTMDMLTQELLFVLEGSDGAAERCAAMESLFWLQVR